MTDPERIVALEARVADLEGRLERLARGPWETLSTRELRLVDSEGRLKGEWRLLAGEAEPRFALYGEGGKPRVVLSVTHDGEPTLALVDAQGHSRAALGTKENAVFLTLRAPDGERTLDLRLDPAGVTGLSL